MFLKQFGVAALVAEQRENGSEESWPPNYKE